MHTSWQEVTCHVLDDYPQLLAADAIDNRRHALRRLHRTALTHSRKQPTPLAKDGEVDVLLYGVQLFLGLQTWTT